MFLLVFLFLVLSPKGEGPTSHEVLESPASPKLTANLQERDWMLVARSFVVTILCVGVLIGGFAFLITFANEPHRMVNLDERGRWRPA